MDLPVTSYLDRDGASLAYQVEGTGPVDVVLYLEITQHLDLAWTDPHLHALLEHMPTYSRTAALQQRGFGLSDPVGYTATIEQQADDILAVMDAVGMHRATLVGVFGNLRRAPALVAAREPIGCPAWSWSTPSPKGCTPAAPSFSAGTTRGRGVHRRLPFRHRALGHRPDPERVGPGERHRLQPAPDGPARALFGNTGGSRCVPRVVAEVGHHRRAPVRPGADPSAAGPDQSGPRRRGRLRG